MKKVLLGILLGVLALCGYLESAAPDQTHTDGLCNGIYWVALTPETKAIYVEAFIEGVVVVASVTETRDGSVINSIPMDKYIPMFDEFYKDPKNLKIPILAAYQYLSALANGADAAELQRRLDHYQKKASKVEDSGNDI